MFISHDRYFINRIATKVVEVRDGRLVMHLGGYDDYQAARAGLPVGAPAPPAETPAPPTREAPRPPARSLPARWIPGRRARRRPRVDPAVRELRRRLDTLEAEIHVELLTAFPYFAAISIIVGSSVSSPSKVFLLGIYNLVYVVPLIGIAIVCAVMGPGASGFLNRIRDSVLTRWPVVVAPLAVVLGLGLTAFGVLRLVAT